MKVENNIVVFGDLMPGDVFSSNNMVFVKIRDIVPLGGPTINAIRMSDGIEGSFSGIHAVIPHPNAVLKLECN